MIDYFFETIHFPNFSREKVIIKKTVTDRYSDIYFLLFLPSLSERPDIISLKKR